DEPAPLDAIYLLAPVRPAVGAPVATRQRLTPMESALVLVAHGKLAPLLGRDEGGRILARAAGIARQVPVFALHLMRDLDRVDDVARTVVGWHATAPPPGADALSPSRSGAPSRP
ncbi:MAG TPA: hypothetical protein VEA99_08015, partial [Gemmatimonadaceae bacterium]|nr:hypothetical protein [Gemmatimonadaceae bacterium]